MKRSYKWFLLLFLNFAYFSTNAQYKFENTMSQYFHNRSLLNPAFTGIDGNKIQLLQNRSWVDFDGAPVLTVFTGEFNFSMNSSGGLHIINDVSGIVHRTTGLMNYAFRVKLNEHRQLRIGIGFSISSERLDMRQLDASAANDPFLLSNINQIPTYDGNIGVLYTTDHLNIGGTFFRIGENLRNNTLGNSDLLLFKAGGYYHFNNEVNDRIQVRPTILISSYKTMPIILDLGTQVIFNKYINIMTVYQSTGNIRAGAGINIPNIGEADMFYNTNLEKAGINAQQFELGLKFRFGNQKK